MAIEIGLPLKEDGVPEFCGDEEIKFVNNDAVLNVNGEDMGPGKLLLGTRRVYWISRSRPSTMNFGVDYQTVGLHALCQDTENWPVPCLYCHFDVQFNLTEALNHGHSNGMSNGCSSEDDQDDVPFSEVRLIPSDPNVLETLFKTFSDMSGQNPDLDAPQPDNEWCTAANQASWYPDGANSELSSEDDEEAPNSSNGNQHGS